MAWNDGKVTQVWKNISKGSDVRHVHIPTGRRPSDPKNFLDPAYSEKASPTATKFSTVTHVGSSVSIGHRRRKRGVCMGSDTPTIYVGDIDMYNPLGNLIPSHANCMQHVLRCWEMQSDGSEYKKTLRRPGLRPGPRWGSLQRSRKPPSWWWWAGCRVPKNPVPRSRPFRPRLSYPQSKISSDAVLVCHALVPCENGIETWRKVNHPENCETATSICHD